MQLACLSTHFLNAGRSLERFLDDCEASGVTAVELGVANRMSAPDLDAKDLLERPDRLAALRLAVESRGLRIAALNCFGNPLHPDPAAAQADRDGILATIRLADALGVDTVTTASGCPGDGAWPIWITWPLYWDGLEPRQWATAIEVWSTLGRAAQAAGVRLCLKLHPGQIAYNTSTFLRLAEASGDAILACLDPAHLFYQGMDPLRVASRLGHRLGHVHAKDSVIDPDRVALDGTIDATPLDRDDRAWRCAAVGEGHDVAWWRDFIAHLRTIGYGGLVSVEHEDARIPADAAIALNVIRLREAGLA